MNTLTKQIPQEEVSHQGSVLSLFHLVESTISPCPQSLWKSVAVGHTGSDILAELQSQG